MPIAKITSDRNQANLPQDLERYCQYALELGADEARVAGFFRPGPRAAHRIEALTGAGITVVPEPSSLLLLGIGAIGLLL